jgi:hypothetical protein
MASRLLSRIWRLRGSPWHFSISVDSRYCSSDPSDTVLEALDAFATELETAPAPPRTPPDAFATTRTARQTLARKPPGVRPAGTCCRSRERSSLVMTRDADGVSRTTLLGRSLCSLPAVLTSSGPGRAPGPFQSRPVVWSSVAVGGPADFSGEPPCDRRRDHSACRPRVAPAHTAGDSVSPAQSCGGAREEPRVRERRALVRAARLGRAEAVVVLCGAERVNRATVAVSLPMTTASERAGRGWGGPRRSQRCVA